MRRLPEDMAGEAAHIVEAGANQAVLAIKSAYPATAGDVRAAVTSKVETTRFGAIATVSNPHKLAYIFEGGTEARHYVTVNGVQHATGRITPGHEFVPNMQRVRRATYEKFRDLLKRKGLEVSDDGL
jgi:hypothetical protein